MRTTLRNTGIVITLGFPLLTSCGSGGNSNSSTSPATPALVGQWHQTSVATPTASANCPGGVPLPDGSTDSCGGNDTFQFRPDGTFTSTLSGNTPPPSGTWQFNGSTLTLNFTSPASLAGSTDTTAAALSNNSNTLTLTYSQGGTTARDIYARQ